MPLRKRCKKFFKSLLQSRLVLAAISTLIYWYARLVGRTTEWQTQGVDELYRVWEKEGSIILIGHGEVVITENETIGISVTDIVKKSKR